VHIAVLTRAQILRTVGDAVLAMGTNPNTIWVDGAVEDLGHRGILIEGGARAGVQFALVMG